MLLFFFLLHSGIKDIHNLLFVVIYNSRFEIEKMGTSLDDETPHLNMAQHWHETFDQIFVDFNPDKWKLEPTNVPMPQGWRTFKDSAKVKFVCDCGNSWTSMNGRVIFWFNKIGDKPELKQEKDQGDSGDSEVGASRSENGNICM